MAFWIAGAALLAVIYGWYAAIVARRNRVREALASVDVHLTQRHDLVPNIVELAVRFMEHERGLIEEVTRLRSRVDAPMGPTPREVEERFGLEAELAQKAGKLLVTMEAYPELRSNTTILEVQRTWTEIEAQIAAARRFYNAAVVRLNFLVQVFPGTLIAGLAGAAAMPFFEAAAEARAVPSAAAIFDRRR